MSFDDVLASDFRCVPELMCLFDGHGRIVHATNSIQKLFVSKYDSILNHTLEELGLEVSSFLTSDTLTVSSKSIYDFIAIGTSQIFEVSSEIVKSLESAGYKCAKLYQFEVRAFDHHGTKYYHGDLIPRRYNINTFDPEQHIVMNTRHIREEKLLAKLKDSILDLMEVPVMVSSKDGAITAYNKAMMDVLGDVQIEEYDQFAWLQCVECYTSDFSRPLECDELLFDKLCSKGQPYQQSLGKIVKGKRKFFKAYGRPIYSKIDSEEQELVGGLVYFEDFTESDIKFKEYSRKNEELFSRICDCMPQMVRKWASLSVAAADNDVGLGYRRWRQVGVFFCQMA